MNISEYQDKLAKQYYDGLLGKLKSANIENAEFIVSFVKAEEYSIFRMLEKLYHMEDITYRIETIKEDGGKVNIEESDFDYILEVYEDKLANSEEWSYILDNLLEDYIEEEEESDEDEE